MPAEPLEEVFANRRHSSATGTEEDHSHCPRLVRAPWCLMGVRLNGGTYRVDAIRDSAAAHVLVYDHQAVGLEQGGNLPWCNMFRETPPGCDASVWIKEQVPSVPDLLKIRLTVNERLAMGKNLPAVDAQQPRVEREVLGCPLSQVARHWIHGEMTKDLAPLERLEDGSLPVIKCVAKEPEIHRDACREV
jgi:hypothetical protein